MATGQVTLNIAPLLTTPYSDIEGHTSKKKPSRDELLPAVAANYRNVIKHIGEDPTREGLLDTPMRAAKAMMYFTKGYTETVQEVVQNAIFTEETDEMVVVRDIEFFTLCEHHMVPFMGKASIGKRRTGLPSTTDVCRLSPQREGGGPVQAGEDRGDVQQEAAGPGEAHQGDRGGGVGGGVPQRGGGGGGGLSHVHGHEGSTEDQQQDCHQLHAGGVQG